jgi:peptidoglycan/xylan/chitin deacetylase (PgdA/CDA1 family)
LHVVQRSAEKACLEWQFLEGDIKGFKLRRSAQPGVHPDPVEFPNGCRAAFTWTTESGYDDTLAYLPIFTSRGLSFTLFVSTGFIGGSGFLNWPEVAFLRGQGVEIGNFTVNHAPLIDDRALALRYSPALACTVAVEGDTLRTYVDGDSLDLEVVLTDASVYYLADLVGYLDAQPDYEATLLYDAGTYGPNRSQWLDEIAGFPIGDGVPACTLTTEYGVHDDDELRTEILDAQAELEDQLEHIDPGYRCRVLAYPEHAHRQRAMSIVNELGYLAARSGPPGPHPFRSQGMYRAGFTTSYEVPLSWPQPRNDWDEATTRSTFQTEIAEWKSNLEWAVILTHHEGEADSQHVAWMIDEIAADPEVWIAPFGQVAAYLDSFATDVGVPVAGEGVASAWLNDLSETDTTYVVVTMYNSAREESGWSNEIAIPPLVSATSESSPPSLVEAWHLPRALPNPVVSQTTLELLCPVAGPARVEIIGVSGRVARTFDLGWVPAGRRRVPWDGRDGSGRPAAAGVYWIRLRTGAGTQVGKAVVRR